jgi:hypothetical protein
MCRNGPRWPGRGAEGYVSRARIEIADAIGRPAYRAVALEPVFSEAVADMRFCLKIRNQFSHCQWHDDLSGRLCFVDMEEIAKSNATITIPFNLTHHYLDTALLIEQEAYFVYVGDCLLYLVYEGRARAGKFASHTRIRPKKYPDRFSGFRRRNVAIKWAPQT